MPDNTSEESAPASFYEWLGLQRHRIDGVGRIAVEVHRDPTFPRTTIQRLHVFLHYYREKSDLRDRIKSAHSEWRDYRRLANPKIRRTKRHLQITRHITNGPVVENFVSITKIEEVVDDQQT